jgi:hypothetical protein
MIGGEGIIRSMENNDSLREERCRRRYFRNGKCLALLGRSRTQISQVTILRCPERPFNSMLLLFIVIMTFDLLRPIFVNYDCLLQGVSVMWFQFRNTDAFMYFLIFAELT